MARTRWRRFCTAFRCVRATATSDARDPLDPSSAEVRECLRASPSITLFALRDDRKTPEFELRQQLLLDESGPEPRLWLRPWVDKHEGVAHAWWAILSYADIAVLHLEDTYSGGCELVVSWESHARTRLLRRWLYAKTVASAVLAIVVLLYGDQLGDNMTLVGWLLLIFPILLADRARKVEREGFDAVAAVQDALAAATAREGRVGMQTRSTQRR